MATIVASKLAIGCLALALVLCLWCAFGSIDELAGNSDKLEDGE